MRKSHIKSANTGICFCKEVLNLESKLEKADLIITGEGKLDGQTISGKAIGELLKMAKSMRRDLIAVPAIVSKDLASLSGFKTIVAAAHDDQLARLMISPAPLQKQYVKADNSLSYLAFLNISTMSVGTIVDETTAFLPSVGKLAAGNC